MVFKNVFFSSAIGHWIDRQILQLNLLVPCAQHCVLGKLKSILAPERPHEKR